MIAVHRGEDNSAHESAITDSSNDNLLNVLMRASKEDKAEEGKGLSDEAISGEHRLATHSPESLGTCLGNVFVFLIAGHEVTACLDQNVSNLNILQ